jgi:hypothetical protein
VADQTDPRHKPLPTRFVVMTFAALGYVLVSMFVALHWRIVGLVMLAPVGIGVLYSYLKISDDQWRRMAQSHAKANQSLPGMLLNGLLLLILAWALYTFVFST